MPFGTLGLCDELLKTVAEQGYTTPSPIQAEAIPAALSRRDVMAVAHTGTGKTAAFTLPVLQLLSAGQSPGAKCVRALIITPTRELAAQVAQSVESYSRHMNITSGTAFGGVRIEPQIAQLEGGLDVLVATPGRLIDLYNQQALNFDQLEILVLDEADRMLALGFVDDIKLIHKLLPVKHQTLLFSATLSKEVKSFAKRMLNDPCLIEVSTPNSTVDTVKQKLYPVDKDRKSELLINLIKRNKWNQILVFSGTKNGADSLVAELEDAGINAASIHADRSQHARVQVLAGFKTGDIKVLVATDIASRGIDVYQLPCVINFDMPYLPEDYVHRIGRTGRAGATGLAITLFSEDESKKLKDIEELIGREFEREIIRAFKPTPKSRGHAADNQEFGNFEADPKPKRRGQAQGRGDNSSNRKKRR